MKVWITKYALSQGILEKEGEQSESNPNMLVITTSGWPDYYHKGDWHPTREAAVIKANDMRVKKLRSLKQQIKKLEAVCFWEKN